MDDVIIILEKFEGIIGALLGVMLTLIMTEIFKRIGKFNFYPVKSEILFEKRISEIYSDYDTVLDKTMADQVKVSLILEIYNSSDSPKILRDGKFNFYKDNELLLSVIPDDNATKRFNGHWTVRDEFLNINIKNKEIVCIDLIETFNKEKTDVIKNCNKLYFETRNFKNKKYKILVGEF